MKKWADYLVSAVRFENSMITYFKVHIDNGNNVSTGATWTRDEVFSTISRGKTFYTIIRDEKGNWIKGNNVFLVRSNGDYRFTDNMNITEERIKGVTEL